MLEAPKLTFASPNLGKVWAAVGPQTRPAGLPLEAALLDAQPFGPDVLRAWSSALLAVRDPLAPLDGRLQARLTLCLIAKAQGRDQDAWRHFERLGDGPSEVACALPHLWPGIPFGTPIGLGGRLELPADTLLQPAFPTLPPEEGPAGSGPQKMTWMQGLQVAGQALELRLTLQPEGLELDLWNRGDTTLAIRAILPSPRNFECSYTYSDWEKTIDPHLGIAVQLPAQREEAWTLFTRLKPAFEAWPSSPKPGTAWFEDRSLRLILGPRENPTPALETLAEVLRVQLDVPVDFASIDDKPAPRCVIVDLGPPSQNPDGATPSGTTPQRHNRMRRLLSSVELFLLP
jgi:hypothetical protein